MRTMSKSLRDYLIMEILDLDPKADISSLEKMNNIQLSFILDYLKKLNLEQHE